MAGASTPGAARPAPRRGGNTYFGDFLVWWGLWLVAAETGWRLLTFPGPVVMGMPLMHVSDVGLLERDIGERQAGDADYMRRTSAFNPRPPRG